MSKYDALNAYLGGERPEKQELVLSLGDIERILNSSLPHTARADRTWWANTLRSNHASKWLKAGWKIGSVDLKKGEVMFTRLDDAPTLTRQADQVYARLKRFLMSIPTKQEQLALTFSELGEILGRKLPTTAFRDRPWWANTKSSPQGSSWMFAGWRVDKVYLGGQVVVFRRKGLNLLRSIPRYVRHILDGSRPVTHPDSHTLLMWIRFCRKIGWYFEGTVLYERGGLWLNSLSEVDQAGIDEDYAVCKREVTLYKKQKPVPGELNE